MRTLDLPRMLVISMVASLLSICTTYGQKSTQYNSVGTKLEEISKFLAEGSNPACEILNSAITNCRQTQMKYESGIHIPENLTVWSEINTNELNDTVPKVKFWPSKQHFAPLKPKRTTNIIDEISEKPKE